MSSLEEEVSKLFRRACRERDWDVAEHLFQALEAIASREGNDEPVEAALVELLEHLPRPDLH